MSLEILILAAGKGTRMKSQLPKVLHPLGGKPMVRRVVETATQLEPEAVHVVIGHGADQIQCELDDIGLNWILQKEQKGTGHAVQVALDSFRDNSVVLILCGDAPLIQAKTLARLTEKVSDSTMSVLTIELDNADGYGRIVRNSDGEILSIVEHKDANETQRAIKETNTGVIAATVSQLRRWLPKLAPSNAQGEYYLTDIVAMAVAEGVSVASAQPEFEEEVAGVNSKRQLAALERAYQIRIAGELMDEGLTLADPNRLDVRGTLSVGRDCFIDVNCVFSGRVILGDGVRVGPNCVVSDATIGDYCEIKSHSVIEGASLGNEVSLGPMGRLRPGAQLADGVKVGNFVEIKKSNIGKNTKVSHLSYIGDATLGAEVNIGAGTITCNYDGVNKFETRIEDGAFVGSNTALVAPVTVGKTALIGAGSTITKRVEDGQLAIARARQKNLKKPTKE